MHQMVKQIRQTSGFFWTIMFNCNTPTFLPTILYISDCIYLSLLLPTTSIVPTKLRKQFWHTSLFASLYLNHCQFPFLCVWMCLCSVCRYQDHGTHDPIGPVIYHVLEPIVRAEVLLMDWESHTVLSDPVMCMHHRQDLLQLHICL